MYIQVRRSQREFTNFNTRNAFRVCSKNVQSFIQIHGSDLYRRGLQGPLLDYAMRKYRGHRTIPSFVIKELRTEFNEKYNFKLNDNLDVN